MGIRRRAELLDRGVPADCFLLDPWWNPATENQAIDRTHRIGQLRPFNVYRLTAANTIEEKVVAGPTQGQVVQGRDGRRRPVR